MKYLGIDIGSRTIKTVVLSDNTIEQWEVADATSRPSETARRMLSGHKSIPVMATGYGRHLLEIDGIPSITEIKACAAGIRHLYSDARLIIDIGGQDLKVISLDTSGKITKFEMNDRCAAGTGKFLEIMAEKLDYTISDFGNAALEGRERININSLCTVFAESEVIGLLNRDEPSEDIAYALHQSVIRKISGIVKRVSSPPDFPVYLVGGGALNSAIGKLIEKYLSTVVHVPDNPQIIVALGASVIASEKQVMPV